MMRRKLFKVLFTSGLFLLNLFFYLPAIGYDLTDKFSVGGLLSGAYQHQWVDNASDKGRGALPFQPEFSFRPTDKDEVSALFGFAAGNGLNDVTEFNLHPWAADLEDDVKNINGRNRDYLLTAWYKHTFEFGGNNTLGLSGGIIDAADYIGETAYSKDEFTDFMNVALTNGSNDYFPSYDIGGAAELEIGNWDFTALGMNIGENEDGNNYSYFGGQIFYKLDTSLGKGNYRLIVDWTTKDFLDKDGDKEKRLAAFQVRGCAEP